LAGLPYLDFSDPEKIDLLLVTQYVVEKYFLNMAYSPIQY